MSKGFEGLASLRLPSDAVCGARLAECGVLGDGYAHESYAVRLGTV